LFVSNKIYHIMIMSSFNRTRISSSISSIVG